MPLPRMREAMPGMPVETAWWRMSLMNVFQLDLVGGLAGLHGPAHEKYESHEGDEAELRRCIGSQFSMWLEE